MNRFLGGAGVLVLLASAAPACTLFGPGDDGADGGSDTVGAGAGGESPVDPCSVPAKATIDQAGGQLTHCEATLVVPPGAVVGPMTIKIRAVPPPAVPLGYELISHAFEIEAGFPIASWSSLTIEHPPAGGSAVLARLDDASGEMRPVAACEVTDTTVQQFLSPTAEQAVGEYDLGTWGVLRAASGEAPEMKCEA